MKLKYEDDLFLADLREHFAQVPFFQFMDVRIVRLSRGEADVAVKIRPEYGNTYGIGHGGVVAALVDMATGVALRTMQIRLVTVETSTNYFERVELGDELVALARVVYLGKRIANGMAEVRNQAGTLVASGKTTFYIIGEAHMDNTAEQKR